MDWVTRMEWIELQEFQKTLSAKWVNISRMHFGSVPPKTSKMENVYLDTIAGFTRLFVDRKHMRPVTGFSVADLTF